jgi:hypothetical protein
MTLAQAITHSWTDVVYLLGLVALGIVNAYVHSIIKGRTDENRKAIQDVKRATGVVKRADDPDPPEPVTLNTSLDATGNPPRRRITDV